MGNCLKNLNFVIDDFELFKIFSFRRAPCQGEHGLLRLLVI